MAASSIPKLPQLHVEVFLRKILLISFSRYQEYVLLISWSATCMAASDISINVCVCEWVSVTRALSSHRTGKML